MSQRTAHGVELLVRSDGHPDLREQSPATMIAIWAARAPGAAAAAGCRQSDPSVRQAIPCLFASPPCATHHARPPVGHPSIAVAADGAIRCSIAHRGRGHHSAYAGAESRPSDLSHRQAIPCLFAPPPRTTPDAARVPAANRPLRPGARPDMRRAGAPGLAAATRRPRWPRRRPAPLAQGNIRDSLHSVRGNASGVNRTHS
jgi:hypothetical protein